MQSDFGKYSLFKIVKIDAPGVHLRLYSNLFSAAPKRINEATLYVAGTPRKDADTVGLEHLPVSNRSFSKWKATFVQQSTVAAGELDGYAVWLERGGHFYF